MPITTSETWLRMLVEAEDRALDSGQDRRSFDLLHVGGMERVLDHPGWNPDNPVPTHLDIDDLREGGWVRMDQASRGKGRMFSLTSDGRRLGQRAQRAHEQAERLPLSMDWPSMEPVLDAAITAYEQAGAPDDGVSVSSIETPEGTPEAAVAELARTGLLINCDAGAAQAEDTFVRPSADAYRLLRAWPQDAAEKAVERLVELLLARAETTDDPEERTRLEGFASWLGKFGSEVIQGVTVGVSTAMLMHGHP